MTNETETHFDYEHQAWIVGGRVARCGHMASCSCYSRIHEGEPHTCGAHCATEEESHATR